MKLGILSYLLFLAGLSEDIPASQSSVRWLRQDEEIPVERILLRQSM